MSLRSVPSGLVVPLVVVAVGVAAGALMARAQEKAPAAGRLELLLGAGWRDDSVTAGLADTTANGGALSGLGLRGAWFGAGSRLGVAAHLRGERFALKPEQGLPARMPVDVTGLDAAGALAARAQVGRRLSFEAQAGYGWLRTPVALIEAGPAGEPRLRGTSLTSHGPRLAAGAHLAVAERVGLELEADAAPVGLGARYDGTAVRPRRYGGRAAASLAWGALGGARWWAVAGYEPSRMSAAGGGVDVAQTEHRFGVGLRASWPGLAQPTPPPPPPAPPPIVRPRPEPPRSTISGVVRAEAGEALPARISIPELGLEVLADDQGAFRFDVKPGEYTLVIEAEGWLTQRKPLSARPGEQRIYNIELQRDRP